MPQIRITNKTKEILDKELEVHKDFARALGEPLPSMAYIAEVVVLEGLDGLKKVRDGYEK